MGVNFKETGWGLTAYSIYMFSLKHFLTTSCHVSDKAGPGQHILQISMPIISFYDVLLRILFLETIQELKQEISAAVLSIGEHHLAGVLQISRDGSGC
jgi:hypothetical protein